MEQFYELLRSKKVAADTKRGVSADVSEEDRKKLVAQNATAEEAIYRMLMNDRTLPISVSHKEAITSRDYPMLLQRVINDRILLPIEPDYIGQSLLATTIQVGRGAGTQYSIPAFGYLEAKEVAETMDYPEQTAEFNRNATMIAIKKYGIAVAVTQEMLEADELGLFGLHIQAAKLAMNRKKEEVIFSLFSNATMPLFDNSNAFTDLLTAEKGAGLTDDSDVETWATNGLDAEGNRNGTLHIFDVIEALSILLARGYTPTDMLVNPIAWPILARDPVLNGFYLNGMGRALPAQAAGAPVFTATSPGSMPSIALPWNLTLHISPFVRTYTRADGLPVNVPYLTDIYIGSRANGVLLLQGRPMQQESYNDIEKEILKVRLKEYYGVGLADMGRSWVSIKNIRVDRAYDIPVVRTITSA